MLTIYVVDGRWTISLQPCPLLLTVCSPMTTRNEAISAESLVFCWHRHCSAIDCRVCLHEDSALMPLHKKIIGSSALIALVVLVAMTGTAEAQRRGGRVVVAPRVVVVGSGFYRPYYYDPFWFDPWYGFYGDQYPWGPYGYPPYRAYRLDPGASLRLQVKPKEAEVYVDGYYAGIVDDFDGTFQRLSVTPGEHDIELYLDGYRTVHQKVYATARKTLNMKYAMERLGAGEQPEPRPQPPEPPPGPQAGAPR